MIVDEKDMLGMHHLWTFVLCAFLLHTPRTEIWTTRQQLRRIYRPSAKRVRYFAFFFATITAHTRIAHPRK
jgi:hypothetical protein